MMKSIRAWGFAMAAIGLFACDQADKPSGPSAGGTGSAQVKLPSVPQGYVPDSALDSSGYSVFQLAITGPDMSPIRQSWILQPGRTEKALISGIPVGWPRVFTGTLIWVTAWGDTLATHEGADTVAISRDSLAQVSLYLRKIGSSGSAEVCVEVEGWGSDSSCVQPSPVTDLSGCWWVTLTYPDTALTGIMRIQQYDSSILMVVDWGNGRDSSRGTLKREVLYMGLLYGMPGFHLKGLVSDSASTINAHYRAADDSVYGGFVAHRGVCDTILPPPPPVDSSISCYLVAQTLNGKTTQGSLRLHTQDEAAWGVFNWNGLREMDVLGSLKAFSGDSSYLNVHGTAPMGMLDSAGMVADTVQYQALIRPNPNSDFQGKVLRLNHLGWNAIGIWKASPKACVADSGR